MIVPSYWAEASAKIKRNGRDTTIKRFGWSSDSADDAQRHAEQRVQDAADRIQNGESLAARERKVAYSGTEGLPIREEVVARHEDVVITRNAYGARCLNVSDVAFVDIDFDQISGRVSWKIMAALLLLGVVGLAYSGMVGIAGTITLVFLALIITYPIVALLNGIHIRLQGGPLAIVRKRLLAFSQKHPHWHLRVYKTFAGVRVLLMHQTFDPRSAEMTACFEALAADRLYVVMCQKQQCFRARVSAKPWRIGLGQRLRPRPGIWPIREDQMAMRQQWVAAYEQKAQTHSVCEFVEQLGSKSTTIKTAFVQRLHDELCGVGRQRALA